MTGIPASGTTRRVGAGWFTLFSLAWLAIWTAQLTPVQLLLPLQLDTAGGEDRWVEGVVFSGLVLGVGGIAGVVAGPLAGALSDRARRGRPRRRPWAVGGSLLSAASLGVIGFAEGPLFVGMAWVGVSVGLAVASAAFTALIADQLSTQRGAASAAVSSAQAVGIVLGVGVVVLLGLGIVDGYLVLAAIVAVLGVGSALLLPDPPGGSSDLPVAGRSARERFAVLRDRDFAWLLWGRLAVNIGNALGTGLLLFFLLYGIGTPAAEAEDSLLLLIVVYTVFVVAASVLGGRLSDRTGRRRGIVVVSALVQAAAAVLIAVAPGFAVTLIAAALLGVGYGAYSTVGLAFATDLLPDERDHARDLGFVNVANNLGQLLGPLIGAGLVAAVGGFWLLFAASAAFSVIGALMNQAIRVARPTSPAPDPAPH